MKEEDRGLFPFFPRNWGFLDDVGAAIASFTGWWLWGKLGGNAALSFIWKIDYKVNRKHLTTGPFIVPKKTLPMKHEIYLQNASPPR